MMILKVRNITILRKKISKPHSLGAESKEQSRSSHPLQNEISMISSSSGMEPNTTLKFKNQDFHSFHLRDAHHPTSFLEGA